MQSKRSCADRNYGKSCTILKGISVSFQHAALFEAWEFKVLSILVIRKHQRFAVRQAVRLKWGNSRPCPGLLVEISLDGCRLAIPGSGVLTVGQPVTLRIDNALPRKAQVRWADNGLVGLRFDQPLHNAELDELLMRCRPQTGHIAELRSYGT